MERMRWRGGIQQEELERQGGCLGLEQGVLEGVQRDSAGQKAWDRVGSPKGKVTEST